MEKVVFFLDYANINRAAREKRYRLDYQDLLQYVSEGRFLIDAYCYVPINPRNEHRLDGEIEEPLIQEVRKSGVRVEVAAFAETAGPDILLKCSGFIDLAVYYENYLAAPNGKQDEENRAEQYKDLIQSQKSEQDEESIAEQVEDLLQTRESDLDEDDEKLPIEQVNNEASVLASDITEELGL